MSNLNWIRYICFVAGVVTVIILTLFLKRHRKRISAETKIYFQEGVKPTYYDIIELYRKLGYKGIAKEIERQSLPCIEFVPKVSGSTESLSCPSKIGGLPDLPDINLWPIWQDKNLSFIAQVNLEQLPESALNECLPNKGILYFFYDSEQSTWGYDPKDKGSWQVIYLDKVPTKLESLSYPIDIPEYARYNEVILEPNAETSIPSLDNVNNLPKKYENEFFAVYEQFLDCRAPLHQLLGTPAQIQGNMQLECQLVSHGLYCGDSSGYNDPKAKELKHGAAEWKLLLQIDSDDNAGMMWGDCGKLYFWIRKNDLRARKFDRTWMIAQCY